MQAISLPNSFLKRANTLLNLETFENSSPIQIANNFAKCPFDNQYILRMMVRSPESDGFKIPRELRWLADTIYGLDFIQKTHKLNNEFVYVTVRHGIVTSETDDEWHVDGFSMRTPHVPEQNYICSSVDTTEFLEDKIKIPTDFDPFRHNIHTFFQRNASNNTYSAEKNKIYLIDPYCIHRRPKQTSGTMRTFWRISFIPIEIEDDTCTYNPFMPIKKYGRKDIRQDLVDYYLDKK